MMFMKKFAQSHSYTVDIDTKNCSFCGIKTRNVNVIDHIIGPYPHPVVRNGKNNEREQSDHQLPGIK